MLKTRPKKRLELLESELEKMGYKAELKLGYEIKPMKKAQKKDWHYCIQCSSFIPSKKERNAHQLDTKHKPVIRVNAITGKNSKKSIAHLRKSGISPKEIQALVKYLKAEKKKLA